MSNHDLSVRLVWGSRPLSNAALRYRSFTPLTPDQNHAVDDALNLNMNERGIDFDKLRPTEWLNDIVISEYTKLINTEWHSKKVYTFSTYFYNQLSIKGYGKWVDKWMNKILKDEGVHVGESKKLLVPVNVGQNHWVLLVVNLETNVLQVYNSLGGYRKECTMALVNLQDCMEQTFGGSPWTIIVTHMDVPRQRNGDDCGVFICATALLLARGLQATFGQNEADANDYRRRMVWELSEERLIPRPHVFIDLTAEETDEETATQEGV